MDKVQEYMQGFKDDDGHLLNVAPDTILIPNVGELKRAVLAAVGSDLDPESSKNAMNFQAGLWNVLVWNYLPKTIGDKPYFIMLDSKFKDDYMCLPFLDRVPLAADGNAAPVVESCHKARTALEHVGIGVRVNVAFYRQRHAVQELSLIHI